MLTLIMDVRLRMEYPAAAHRAMARGHERYREAGAFGFQLEGYNMNEHTAPRPLLLNLPSS